MFWGVPGYLGVQKLCSASSRTTWSRKISCVRVQMHQEWVTVLLCAHGIVEETAVTTWGFCWQKDSICPFEVSTSFTPRRQQKSFGGAGDRDCTIILINGLDRSNLDGFHEVGALHEQAYSYTWWSKFWTVVARVISQQLNWLLLSWSGEPTAAGNINQRPRISQLDVNALVLLGTSATNPIQLWNSRVMGMQML